MDSMAGRLPGREIASGGRDSEDYAILEAEDCGIGDGASSVGLDDVLHERLKERPLVDLDAVVPLEDDRVVWLIDPAAVLKVFDIREAILAVADREHQLVLVTGGNEAFVVQPHMKIERKNVVILRSEGKQAEEIETLGPSVWAWKLSLAPAL